MSPTMSHWVLHPRHDAAKAAELAAALGAPLPIGHVLVNRGIASLAQAQNFLSPQLENLHDPSEMLGIDAAAERIFAAIAKGEKISVEGDYDVDGITSTFLLHSALVELGADAVFHIPHRIDEGYGLKEGGVRRAHEQGCTLLVTVDCGVTAVPEIALARSLGMDTVVTDHHEPPAKLPDAVAIVNPLQPGCPYPFKSLAGVGVAFKLVERLFRDSGGLEHTAQWLDVVALGTIADVVPLVGENRVLARLGLERMNRQLRPGLRALAARAGLRETNGSLKPVTATRVAFNLAPRLNAAGRMGDAADALRLLQAPDAVTAERIASLLESRNEERRVKSDQAQALARRLYEDARERGLCGSSIVLWSKEWHPGVVGIVATRLAEQEHKPTLLLTQTERAGAAPGVEPTWRGSGRSIPGVDLTRLLGECDDLLLGHGGHAFAAGLELATANLEAFRRRFDELAARDCAASGGPALLVDAEVTPSDCTLDLVDWIERLAPHGLENGEPVFQWLGAEVQRASTVGQKAEHLRLELGERDVRLQAIGFHMGHQLRVDSGRTADLAFTPTRNDWNGETRVQLKLREIRLA
ncbi:MAG: single-stranded-DNA-specific exonuclease RecJ [Candidatus Eisenbacteria bacterium]